MHFVLVDAGILSVPPYLTSEDDVFLLVQRLTNWSSSAGGDSPLRLRALSDIQETLTLAGSWPIEADVTQMLEMYGLKDVFSVNDLLTAYFNILEAAQPWEDQGVEVIEYDTLDLNPDMLAGHSPKILADHTRRVYASAACCPHLVNGYSCGVASGLPHTGPVPMTIDSNITALRGLGSENISLPVQVDATVWLLDDVGDLSVAPGGMVLWNNAQGEGDFFLAIGVEALAVAASGGQKLSLGDLPRYSLGPEFVASLHAHQAAAGQVRASIVLQTCARLLAGVPKHQPKLMGKKATIERARDGAKAWRTHVYKGHEGLRLMYWDNAQSIEFANVENKQDVTISYGYAGGEYSYEW